MAVGTEFAQLESSRVVLLALSGSIGPRLAN